jgi:predicted metalloendopeptidase
MDEPAIETKALTPLHDELAAIAFGIQPGQRLYLSPTDRVRVW